MATHEKDVESRATEQESIGTPKETTAYTPDPIKPVDTVHNDEALKVLANYHGDETWTEQEEASLRRRIDWKLMPVLCLTYGLQYYDKGEGPPGSCRDELTILYSYAQSSRIVWSPDRPQTLNGQSIQHDSIYLLSRVYCWGLSSNVPGAKVPHRARSITYRCLLGHHASLDKRLHQLPRHLRAAVLPGNARGWY
jgi:hypothetical protein